MFALVLHWQCGNAFYLIRSTGKGSLIIFQACVEDVSSGRGRGTRINTCTGKIAGFVELLLCAGYR
jgi:hypothetical protein